MRLLLFIKNLLKNTINTNNIVVILELLRNANYLYIGFIATTISIISWFPSTIESIPNPIFTIRMLPQIIFAFLYFIDASMLVHMAFKHNMPQRVLKYSKIKGVSKLSNFFDYYYTLIPVFLVTTGIALITLTNLHEYFVLAGALLIYLGINVFFIFYLLKITSYNMGTLDRYNNITRAKDIFTNYISSNDAGIKYRAIKEFTKNFKRVLDGIDSYFDIHYDKRVKIDYLQNAENITVKQLIVRYLPLYLRYCSETELRSFERKLNSMASLIDNDNKITSLDIIKIVHSIHQDIATFLNEHYYIIPKNNLFTNFISYINTKHFFLLKISVAIFIIAGLFMFFIPDGMTNFFNETFGYIAEHEINLLTFISTVIASVTLLIKCKDLMK